MLCSGTKFRVLILLVPPTMYDICPLHIFIIVVVLTDNDYHRHQLVLGKFTNKIILVTHSYEIC